MTDFFFYPTKDLTGGGDGAVDALDGSILKEGDAAYAVLASTRRSYVFSLDEDSGLAESSPNVIAPDANAGLKRWVRTNQAVSSDETSFIQSGTGAVSRTTQSKLRDTVSVFDFMTTAQIADVHARTALVNVAVPVQAALDSGAAMVYFPKGKYQFGLTSLALPDWIHIAGEGYQPGIGSVGRFTEFVFAHTSTTAAILCGETPLIENILFYNNGGTYTDITFTLSGTAAPCIETRGSAFIRNCSFYGWYICIEMAEEPMVSSPNYIKTENVQFNRCTIGYSSTTVQPFNLDIKAPISRYCDNFLLGTNAFPPRNVKVFGGSIEDYATAFKYFREVSCFGTYFETITEKVGAVGFDPIVDECSVSLFGCLVYMDYTARFVNGSGIDNMILVSHGNKFEGKEAAAAASTIFHLPDSGSVVLMGDRLNAAQQHDCLYVDSLTSADKFIVKHPTYPALHHHLTNTDAFSLGMPGFNLGSWAAAPSTPYTGQVVMANGVAGTGWDPLGYNAGRPYLVIWQGDRWRSVSGA